MSLHHLANFFAPKSVALIGAGTRTASVGQAVLRNMLASGFKGEIWPVNPKYERIGELVCYRSLHSLPASADLAVLMTPAATIPELIADLAANGTKAAIVITGGLDSAATERMRATAKRAGLRLIGPNCLGVLAPPAGLNASFAQGTVDAGDLALISQSGAIIAAMLDWAKARGIGFSHVVSLGNMLDVDVDDLLDFLAGDPKAKAILLYLEHITDGPRFMSAARSAARAKPVIVVKAGRHPAAAKAAASHTGAMAGSDDVYEAAFERAGLIRVTELDHLFSAAEVLARGIRISGERVAIVTNGGGAGVLAVDRLQDLGGTPATLLPRTLAILDRKMPAGWSHGNPVDIVGDAGPDRYAAAMSAVLEDSQCDAAIVLNCPVAIASSTDAARAVVEAVAGAKARKPVLAAWLGADAVAAGRKLLANARIPSFETPAAAVDGIMHLVRYERAQKALMQTPPASVLQRPPDTQTARAVIEAALRDGRTLLSEAEAKAVLSAYNIPVAETRLARTPDEAATLTDQMLQSRAASSRAVIKISSRDISHKSDVGGVRLNVLNGEEARAVAQSMIRTVERLRPGAIIDGFMVQPMIERADAFELIVGLAEDPVFGPIVLFGAGGTGVEVISDKALALPPLDAVLALSLMRRTRIFRQLQGYRDRLPCDLDAISVTLISIAGLAADLPEIQEIDINPLLADANGVIALDARIVVRASPRQTWRGGRFAIRPYPKELEQDVRLTNGRTALLRPIRPEDERLYTEFLARVSPEDMRLRFFSPMKELSHAFIARLTQIDYARQMAFIVLDRPTGELLGVSRFFADPDLTSAEFAVLVRSDLHGLGVGWLLMRHLIDHARLIGVGEIYGHVLKENVTMLKMAAEMGFISVPSAEAPGTYRVSLTLANDAPH